MKGINNVLYGRNHSANRRWYAFEIRNSLEAAFTDPAVGPDFYTMIHLTIEILFS